MSQQEILNSEMQILTNSDLARSVVAEIGIGNFHPDFLSLGIPFEIPLSRLEPLAQAVLGFEKNLSVEAVRKSNVILVSFINKDPRIAAKTVNPARREIQGEAPPGIQRPRSSFLEQQLANTAGSWRNPRSAWNRSARRTASTPSTSSGSLLIRRHSDLDAALKAAEHQSEETTETLDIITRQQKMGIQREGDVTRTRSGRGIIVDARTKLLALQLQEQEQLKLFSEDNRLVQSTPPKSGWAGFPESPGGEIAGKVMTGNVVYQELEKDRNRTEADLSAQIAKSKAIRAHFRRSTGRSRPSTLLEKELRNSAGRSGQRKELTSLPGRASRGPDRGRNEPPEEVEYQHYPEANGP
jgi:hypothetical protein